MRACTNLLHEIGSRESVFSGEGPGQTTCCGTKAERASDLNRDHHEIENGRACVGLCGIVEQLDDWVPGSGVEHLLEVCDGVKAYDHNDKSHGAVDDLQLQ